jgi:hypothetical protein
VDESGFEYTLNVCGPTVQGTCDADSNAQSCRTAGTEQWVLGDAINEGQQGLPTLQYLVSCNPITERSENQTRAAYGETLFLL